MIIADCTKTKTLKKGGKFWHAGRPIEKSLTNWEVARFLASFSFFCTLAPSRLPSSTLNALLLFFCSFFFIVEDKGDSPGIDSDSSSSSPAPPSSHNQRTASSVSISGTHYHQTTAGLIKGIIRTPKMLALSSYLFYFFLPSLFCFVFFIFQTTHCWYIYFSNNLQL